jgi:hypothetical protein
MALVFALFTLRACAAPHQPYGGSAKRERRRNGEEGLSEKAAKWERGYAGEELSGKGATRDSG